MPGIHISAQSGYSKATSNYHRGRPGYPQQIEMWLRDTLHIRAGMKIVDLGAGTGKFTQQLVDTKAEVIAIEPVREMLDRLASSFKTVEIIQATATQMPLEDESVDAVFCAQAFHWFASIDALAEIRRVLKPGGILGLVWNIRDKSCDWIAQLTRIMQPYEDGTPRFHHGKWRKLFPADGFSALLEQEFDHSHDGDFQSVVVDRVMSVSFIAALSPSQRDKVRDQIEAMAVPFEQLADKNNVSFPYKTLAAWAAKL